MQVQQTGLRALFEQDPHRAKRFSLEVGDIYCDYAKNLITPELLAQLVEWAALARCLSELRN